MSDVSLFKERLKSICKGIDTSVKLGYNNSFCKLFDEIEENVYEKDCDLKKKLDLIYNTALLKTRRMKNGKVIERWLMNGAGELYDELFLLLSLNVNNFLLDKDAVKYFKEHEEYGVLTDSFQSFSLTVNNKIYLVEPKVHEGGFYLYVYTPPVESGEKKFVIYTFEALVRIKHDGEKCNVTTNIEDISVACSNTSCPRYKQCLGVGEVFDNLKIKRVNCMEVKDCKFVEEVGKLLPDDCVKVALGVMNCIQNREYPSYVKDDSKEYEHVPMPENTSAVRIYLGESTTNKERLKVNKGDNNIVSSHASPREHTRRGGTRRGYYRKNGTYVKPTTFRSTVVNKGHTKCDYEIKVRNKSIKEDNLDG